MRVESTSRTGHVRRRNEDQYLVDADRHLLVVADGMGGHPAGDVASKLAVEAVDAGLDPGDLADRDRRPRALREAVTRAHTAIGDAVAEEPAYRGMGTTLIVAHLDESGELLTVAHVGDSRAYLLRDDELRPLTHDHVTDDLSGRRRLTQAVGASQAIQPEVAEIPVQAGDRLLLCTDGLTDQVHDDTICSLAGTGAGPDEALERLTTAALDAGGQDNVTIIVADVTRASEPA